MLMTTLRKLEDQEVRMPLSLSPEKYFGVCSVGASLLCTHYYGTRSCPPGTRLVDVSHGAARYNVAISTEAHKYPEKYEYCAARQALCIGDGEFGPVAPEVMAYEVSGQRVVESWLGYRMKDGKGRKSSPPTASHPDCWGHEFYEELLQLLWLIEHTVALHATLADLLAKIRAGPMPYPADVPAVPDDLRMPPRTAHDAMLFGQVKYTTMEVDNEAAEDDDDNEVEKSAPETPNGKVAAHVAEPTLWNDAE
jgi:hypothetical protein